MWDKHRQIRQHSRKRAMRAARVRAGERGGTPLQPDVTKQETKPDEPAAEPAQRADRSPVEGGAPPEADITEQPPHDPASSLAWTGLIVLALLLGGFMVAVMFLLG